MSLLQRIADLFKPQKGGGTPHPGYGNGAGMGTGMGWFGRIPGTQVNWMEEAGPLELNSVVYACVAWKAQQAHEGELVNQRRTGGQWADAPPNAVVELLLRPNEFYGWEELLTACVASLDITGNFYALKIRDGQRRVAELWWIPSHLIGPEWDATQRTWTDYYRYTSGGGTYRIHPSDVVHVRAPLLNRLNPRLGQSPLESVLRDVAGDNGASSLMANVFGRNGMPSHLITPKDSTELSPDQAIELGTQLSMQYSGDDRARLATLNFPVQAIPLEWKPGDMGVDKARYGFEERICAVLGVPPVVIGMGSGLEKSTAKASYHDSRRAAYEGCIIPMQNRIAMQLYRQLAPDMVSSPGLFRLAFNVSGVSALKESANDEVKRNTAACGGPYMTVNEVRAAKGLPPIDGGDVLRGAVKVDQDREPAQEEESNEPDA